MKAIRTTFLGRSDHQGARIRASAEGCASVSYAYDHGSENPHLDAARVFAEELGWDGTFTEGHLPDGSRVWVLAGGTPFTIEPVTRVRA